RLLPGALGNDASTADESFQSGGLEYPHYTRPREFRGLRVPEVLLSGDHAAIENWRREQARRRTRQRRPDLADDTPPGASLFRRGPFPNRKKVRLAAGAVAADRAAIGTA
ncbi:MAG: hypothetical protein D6744_08405, partial [Planctomycetota bacterium]